MYRTRILRSAAEFPAIRQLWDELAGGTIFQSYLWNRVAAEAFAATEAPFVVICESDSGAAIVPAVLRQDNSIGLIGERLFDYRDVLSAGDEAVVERAWSELARLDLPFRVIALRGTERYDQWRAARPSFFANAPCVRLRDLAETPLAAAERFICAQRRLGRHSRNLRRQGAVLRRHPGADSDLLRWLYHTKGQQPTSGENLFADPTRREFMIRIAAEPEARCEVFTYESGADIVAALVTFRDDGCRYFYTTYFDPRWERHSPGVVLLFEATAQSLTEGLDCDYLTGEYPYKNRLATAQVPLFTVELAAEEMASVFYRQEATGTVGSPRAA